MVFRILKELLSLKNEPSIPQSCFGLLFSYWKWRRNLGCQDIVWFCLSHSAVPPKLSNVRIGPRVLHDGSWKHLISGQYPIISVGNGEDKSRSNDYEQSFIFGFGKCFLFTSTYIVLQSLNLLKKNSLCTHTHIKKAVYENRLVKIASSLHLYFSSVLLCSIFWFRKEMFCLFVSF